MHKMIRVLLIGQYPPPIGGVTIHLQRFFEKYKNSDEFSLSLLDVKKKYYYAKNDKSSIWASLQKILSTDIVHIHIASNLKIIIAIFYKLLGKKVVYTQHNIRIKNMKLFKIFMLFVDKLILVNDKNMPESIKKYNYALIPAFLPSLEYTPLPEEVVEKIKKYDNIISTNCFQMTYIEGKDLYGFDLCVDALNILVKTQKIENTLLVLVDPSGTTKNYVQELLKSFETQNNCDIYYIDHTIDFSTLIKSSTMVLRATRSDGDSLTIRESLHLNVPIIASDITWRPEGTIIFKHEDSNDLSHKIFDVIDGKILDEKNTAIDNGEKLIAVYKRLKDDK